MFESTPTASVTLELFGISKRYKPKTALDGLSFTAVPGEILGILGPNGAGKSTSLAIAAGFMRADAGEVRLNGRPAVPAELRAAVSLVPETPDVFPMLTVYEHLLFVAKALRLPVGWNARADELLERFDLGAERATLGAGLSKGMRQKVLVAAALLRDAPVLIFDEPMIGLDPLGQREFRDLLREMRALGHTVVLSTHQIDAAQSLCDAMVFVKSGRAVVRTTKGESTEALERAFLEATA